MKHLYSIFYLCIDTGLKSCNLAFQVYAFSLNADFFSTSQIIANQEKEVEPLAYPQLTLPRPHDSLSVICEHVSSFAFNLCLD